MANNKPTKRPSVKDKTGGFKKPRKEASVSYAKKDSVESYSRDSYAEQKRVKASRSAQSQKASVKASGETKAGKRTVLSRKFLLVSGVVALVLVIAIGALSWNQWLRYDDAADVQGSWVAQGTEQVVTITDSEIVWTDSVSYSYSLDAFAKTITFNFKQYSGQGSYAFSDDRNAFSITEVDSDSGEEVTTTLVRQ